MAAMQQISAAALGAIDSLIRASGAPRNWPPYATRTFTGLALACLGVGVLSGQFTSEKVVASPKAGDSKAVKDVREQRAQFRKFQVSYLTVYLLTMLADWLQGTNMYTLYKGYDMPVATLFLTGFTSSALFGSVVGLKVDQYGRKFGCVLFCVLEIIINTLEHFPNIQLLLLGRVLGGISTNLLFTAFESWMVTEHRKRKFPEEWLASTQGIASTGNGVVAVLAGVLAQFASDVSSVNGGSLQATNSLLQNGHFGLLQTIALFVCVFVWPTSAID